MLSFPVGIGNPLRLARLLTLRVRHRVRLFAQVLRIGDQPESCVAEIVWELQVTRANTPAHTT